MIALCLMLSGTYYAQKLCQHNRPVPTLFIVIACGESLEFPACDSVLYST